VVVPCVRHAWPERTPPERRLIPLRPDRRAQSRSVARLARGTGVPPPVDVSRGADHRGNGPHIRGAGSRHRLRRFVAAARSVHLVRDLDPVAVDLEGYLFPDTYGLPRSRRRPTWSIRCGDDSRRCGRRWLRPGQPRGQPRRSAEIVTLASLVEEETAIQTSGHRGRRGTRNRLRIGMGCSAIPR